MNIHEGSKPAGMRIICQGCRAVWIRALEMAEHQFKSNQPFDVAELITGHMHGRFLLAVLVQ